MLELPFADKLPDIPTAASGSQARAAPASGSQALAAPASGSQARADQAPPESITEIVDSPDEEDKYTYGFCHETMLLFRRTKATNYVEPAMPIATEGKDLDSNIIGQWPDGEEVLFKAMTIRQYLHISGLKPAERLAKYPVIVPGKLSPDPAAATSADHEAPRGEDAAEAPRAAPRAVDAPETKKAEEEDVLVAIEHAVTHHALTARQKVDHKLLVVMYEQKKYLSSIRCCKFGEVPDETAKLPRDHPTLVATVEFVKEFLTCYAQGKFARENKEEFKREMLKTFAVHATAEPKAKRRRTKGAPGQEGSATPPEKAPSKEATPAVPEAPPKEAAPAAPEAPRTPGSASSTPAVTPPVQAAPTRVVTPAVPASSTPAVTPAVQATSTQIVTSGVQIRGHVATTCWST